MAYLLINVGVSKRAPRLVVDVSTAGLTLEQRIAQQIDYDEFGNVLSDTSPAFQPFGFAGGSMTQKRDWYGLVRATTTHR